MRGHELQVDVCKVQWPVRGVTRCNAKDLLGGWCVECLDDMPPLDRASRCERWPWS